MDVEKQATEFIAATQTALDQASALAVQYAFSVVGAIILLVVGWIVARVLSRWAYQGISRVRGIDETLARFFTSALYYGLLILVFITVLGQFGVQTASIIATLGAAGIAIGLALQGTLQNIAAGIMLLVLRPFRVGEYIETGTVAGTVRDIGLFATEMKTPAGLYLLAPNSTLWNTPITNFSREPTRKHELIVAVPQANLDEAMETLLSLAHADPNVEQSPSPQVFIKNIAGSIEVTLQYWVKTGAWTATTRDMLLRTKSALEAKGVSLG